MSPLTMAILTSIMVLLHPKGMRDARTCKRNGETLQIDEHSGTLR
jgi:hypothetical protein